MPIYEYEPLDGACKVCGGCFQLNRPVDRVALTECPLCKKAVRKRLSNFSTPKASKAPSVSEAKGAGFTVLKRVGKGEYERQ